MRALIAALLFAAAPLRRRVHSPRGSIRLIQSLAEHLLSIQRVKE